MWIAVQPLGSQNRVSPDPMFGSLPRHLTCSEMATEHCGLRNYRRSLQVLVSRSRAFELLSNRITGN